MEKVNGGTLESFIKKRRLKIMKSLKNKSEIPENNNGKKNDNIIYLQNEIIKDIESSDDDTIIHLSKENM